MSCASQNIDDSPNSDNKMDISDPTTISQESIGLSPDAEQNSLMTPTETVMIRMSASVNSKMRTSNTNSGSDQQPENKFVDTKLDNRNLVNKNSHMNQKQRISLTKVEMHPLMEPPIKSDDHLSSDSSTMFDGTYTNTFHTEIIHMETEPQIDASPIKQFDSLELPNSLQNIDDKHMMSSDESEPDVSQYQAMVEPTFQSVSLTNYNIVTKSNPLRKIPLTNELKLMTTHEDSSIETISNNSFDDDAEDEDGFSVMVTSSNIKQMKSNNGKNKPVTNENGEKTMDSNDMNAIAIASASASASAGVSVKEIQHTSTIAVTLSNGQTRDIDMKVIEPYKRCLSHGGYIKSPGHNAIVIFSACYLPDRSRTDYHYVMDNLFLYVIKTLDQFVTDDYILIYLHGGSTRSTVPPLPWLKKCYHLLDRRIRKSLKNLYMVHPTFWLKSIVWMARPFISSKFWRKLVYIRTLDDLYEIIPVEKAAVPDKVKLYDKKHSDH